MGLGRYLKKLFQQYVALLYKQGLVAQRNWISTFVRVIVAPFAFVFLIWIVNEAVTTDNDNLDAYRDLPTPQPEPVKGIPYCGTDLYITPPCYDFFWTPNTSTVVQTIVSNIQANNPSRAIPDSSVIGFASLADSNSYLRANPQKVLGGLHFSVDGGDTLQAVSGVSFTVQSNGTAKFFKGNYQDPNTFFQVPAQVAAEREISRLYFSKEGKTFDPSNWQISLTSYPHPAISALSVIGQVAGPFIFAANLFGFVLALGAVVLERELKLRQALRTMGQLDSAYWLSWMTYEICMAIVTSLLLGAFGALFQFEIFLRNSFGIIFLLFFLFQLSMASLAFLLSTFVGKASTAVNLGFVVFVIGWLMQTIVLFGYPFVPKQVKSIVVVTVLFALCPWTLLAKAFNDLGLATANNNPGIGWGQRSSYCENLPDSQAATQVYDPNIYKDYKCVLNLNQVFNILLLEWVVYFIIAVYLDNILPNESGVRRPPWYFLMPNYWFAVGRGNARHQTSIETASGHQHLKPSQPLERYEGEAQDADVAAEQARVQELLNHRTGAPGRGGAPAPEDADAPLNCCGAVEVYGLQKGFGASVMRKLCCRSSQEFWAIKGAWFTAEEGQLFALLGPNGAGKSTTINCLTGVLPPSGGDALIHGEALSAPGGLDRIRASIGVCPQFDILWSELTGREHLIIYGNIKGIPRALVDRQADELLEKVKLTEAANITTGAYSGGMKRRLSVAIALLGDPQVIFLDEPTTGMDPISRRFVWDIVEASKKGRAIILTTHSMEEADVLGDKIGIMCRGRLRALGSSIRLKQRFGSGYQISVSVGAAGSSDALSANRASGVKQVFREQLELEPSDETKAYMRFLVPQALEGRLTAFLADLERRSPDLGITDLQVSLTTLEEVFLTIARQAEVEAARLEGSSNKVITLENGTQLEVPLGEEVATDVYTGTQYEIKWAQDENGNLDVLSWHPLPSSATA